MMNIIFLEDRGTVSYYLSKNLESSGHTVFEAFSVPDARTYWEDEDIHCIIVDLNLSPDGLTEEERARTREGLLSGWIWVKEYVLREKPEMRDRIIIYSEYLSQLKTLDTDEDFKEIKKIGKQGSESPVQELLDAVELISQKTS